MKWVIVCAGLFLLECAVKCYFRKTGADGAYFGNRLRLSLVFNDGLALGKGRAHPVLIRIGTGIAALILSVFWGPMLASPEPLFFLPLSAAFLLAGAWNNVGERLLFGAVTDYVSFPRIVPKKLRRIVFNLSDFYLLIGVLSLIFEELPF